MASKNTIKIGNPALSWAPRTSLVSDVSSGWTTLSVRSTTWFPDSANYYLLIGTYWSDNAEIVLASAKTVSSFTVWALQASHSSSDPVVVIPYNKVKYYGREASGGSSTLLDTVNIDCTEQFTSYTYTPSLPEYVFFVSTYYNESLNEESWMSDEISLSTFNVNSVKSIIESWVRKALTFIDENPKGKLSWATLIDIVNEGLSEILTRKKKWQCLHKIDNSLVTTEWVEYMDKPEDLSVLEFIYVDWKKVDYITKYKYNQYRGNTLNVWVWIPQNYTIKNDKIYFIPCPSSNFSTSFEYYSVPSTITSLTDEVKKEFTSILIHFVAAQAAYIRNNEKRGNLMESKYIRVLENQIEDVTWEEQSGDSITSELTNSFFTD